MAVEIGIRMASSVWNRTGTRKAEGLFPSKLTDMPGAYRDGWSLAVPPLPHDRAYGSYTADREGEHLTRLERGGETERLDVRICEPGREVRFARPYRRMTPVRVSFPHGAPPARTTACPSVASIPVECRLRKEWAVSRPHWDEGDLNRGVGRVPAHEMPIVQLKANRSRSRATIVTAHSQAILFATALF
jgi:hypothetical protein